MIKFVKKYLTPSSHSDLKVKESKEATFQLTLDDRVVGILSFKDGKWMFKYSDEFKEDNLTPISGFPDLDKIYKSEELWPFFSSRIPSLARKNIQDKIKKKGINENDYLELLSFFGKRTITNPFELNNISH